MWFGRKCWATAGSTMVTEAGPRLRGRVLCGNGIDFKMRRMCCSLWTDGKKPVERKKVKIRKEEKSSV